jgi:hypothetical protein
VPWCNLNARQAVCRQAAINAQTINPWRLAALLEGLRLRTDRQLRIVDRSAVFDAARLEISAEQLATANWS